MNAVAAVLIGLCIAVWSTESAAQGIEPGTTWVNDRGSELHIDSIDKDGHLAGTYINRAAGFQCQGTPYPVIGWVEGDEIGFSVRWKSADQDCQSITSWTGYYEAGRIVTDWDLVYLDSVENGPLMYRGSDHFVPQ